MDIVFSELIDINNLQKNALSLYKAAGIPVGIYDERKEEFVVKAGWQDICLKFHRVNEDSCKRCNESDKFIQNHKSAGKFVEYKCKNGMWDSAIPLITHDQHIATIFIGQYFYDDEIIEISYFEKQAEHFGFSKKEYITALKKVPVFSRKKIEHMINFYSEQVNIITNLALAKLQAEESNRLKSSFLANISHEVRTPLNAILGFTDILLNDNSSLANVNDYVQIINDQGNQLLHIVNDIIDISAIESGNLKLNKQVFVLDSFFNGIKNNYKHKSNSKKIDFEINIDQSCNHISVKEDKEKLRQILNNLIENAIKYTNKGKVFVNFKIEEKHLNFSVKDTGIGIPAEYHKKIFKRFYQVENSDVQNNGNGLGLAICNAIIDRMGGNIHFNSEVNVGTTFIVSLPLTHTVYAETE